MRAGRLRQKIILQEPNGSQDAVGERNTTWGNTIAVRADIKPLRVNEQFIAAQNHASTTHKIRIRYSSTRFTRTVIDAVSLGGGLTRITVKKNTLDVGFTSTLSAFTGDWAGLNNLLITVTASTTGGASGPPDYQDTIDFAFDSSTYAAYSGNAGEIERRPVSAVRSNWRVKYGSRIFTLDGDPKNIMELNRTLELSCTEGLREE